MNPVDVEISFRKSVADAIRITDEGIDRYRVFTPFVLEDGDHLVVVMRRDGSSWVLSRFSDVCEKQFSSLTGNRDRITHFLQEAIAN